MKPKWFEKTVENIPVITHPQHYALPEQGEKPDAEIEVETIKLFGIMISNNYLEES